MLVAEVLVQYSSLQLDKTFHYALNDNEAEIGSRVWVKFNNRKIVGIILNIEKLALSKDEYFKKYGFYLNDVEEVIDKKSILNQELIDLAYHLKEITISPLISCISIMLPSKLKVNKNFDNVKYLTFLKPLANNDEKLTKLQNKAYQFLLENQKVLLSDFYKQYSYDLLKRLENKNLVKRVLKEEVYVKQNFKQKPFLKLTKNQKDVYQEILETSKAVYLLHGVTGSGKTEVFLHLAKHYLANDKTVMILVPEIALTPQMIALVQSRFNDQVAIYHSYLTQKEKYLQYQRVKNNQVKLVVGTRSSIFLPLENIGLIVLDEEHDHSYKQNSKPYYHTRDVAIYRAKRYNAKVLLASATPSLESYSRAIKNVYHLLTLDKKISLQTNTYQIVDMRKKLYNQENDIISHELASAIKLRLEKGEQSVILLNRRGYSPTLVCKNCFEVKKCQNCDIALSYHKDKNTLVCHSCGIITHLPTKCDNCQNTTFTYKGYGTQRVYHHLQNLFKDANIVRMDYDQVRDSKGHQNILDKFEKEGDILLGTQMIAKGLDYHNITLVGILNADASLNYNSFRSSEDTFNLITQVSGRGGRGDLASELIVQSFDTSHYAIVLGCRNDYLRFFNQEMKYRHLANYPPYSFLIKIVLSFYNEDVLIEKSELVKEILVKEDIWQTLGYSELIKLKKLYRHQFILRGKNLEEMIKTLNSINENILKILKNVNISIDVNPMEME